MTDLQTALAALKTAADTPAASTPSPDAGKPQASRKPEDRGTPNFANQPTRPRPASAAPADAASTTADTSTDAPATQVTPRQPPRCMPTLEKLATLYPKLFGEVFLPMKRGIYQDLLAAHPADIDKDILKEALAFHSRSTRYLIAVSSGQQRHDLTGAPVEAMAPEHIHHALMEVFRRRQGRAAKPQTNNHGRNQGRPPEDLHAKLINRITQAQAMSGLSRQAYADLVRSKDEAANAILDEAMQQAATRDAKDEALLSTFTASGETIEAFADMYGMNPRTVAASLERAQTR